MPIRLLLLVLALGLAASSRAEACSAGLFQFIGAVPLDGATQVPTNARIRMNYSGAVAETELVREVQVRPLGGEPVGLTVTVASNLGNPSLRVGVAIPDVPLDARTTYEILGRVDADCLGLDCAGDHRVVSTFTTGEGPDVTPPVFAGLRSIQVSPLEACGGSSCCGPYEVVRFALTWDAGSDESGVVAYQVHAEGHDAPLVAAGGRIGVLRCSGSFTGGGPGGDFYAGSGTYFVRAVDVAGNEDSNAVKIPVVVECSRAMSDGGPSDAGEARSDAGDDAPAIDRAGPGCACSGTSVAVLLQCVAVGAILRRRGPVNRRRTRARLDSGRPSPEG